MEICFKDSPSQGMLTDTDHKSGFDLPNQHSAWNHWEWVLGISEVLEPAWCAGEYGDFCEALLLVAGYPHETEKPECYGGPVLLLPLGTVLLVFCSDYLHQRKERTGNSSQCSWLSWEVMGRGETKASGFVYDDLWFCLWFFYEQFDRLPGSACELVKKWQVGRKPSCTYICT